MAQSGFSQPSATAGPAIDWGQELARHDRWLRTVVAARVSSRHAVDDVMQEVALAAVAQRAPLADAAKAAPWLYRLAVTQSLLYRRKLGRQRRLVERYAWREQPAETNARDGDPLGWLLAGERQQIVRQELERLPRRDREILLLKYTENWNYRQLADHLGVSHSAVEARLHRARARLRQAIAHWQLTEVSAK